MSMPYVSFGLFDIFQFEGEVKVGGLLSITSYLSKHIQNFPGKHLVIGLEKATFIDSSTIRLLINLKKRIEETNKRQVALLNPSEVVIRILSETNLDKVFVAFKSIAEIEQHFNTAHLTMYAPYTSPEGGLPKLHLTCAVCGSKQVSGYQFDKNRLEWKWEDDDPYPSAVDIETQEPFNAFGLMPIICNECFMCSINIHDFHVVQNDIIIMRSPLTESSKYALSKSIKKRKKIMEADTTYTEKSFNVPRNSKSCYYAYALAATCAHNMAIQKTDSSPFMIGYLNYLAIQYADTDVKAELIDNSRTWLTQVLADHDKETFFYDHLQIAQALFICIYIALNLGKPKEAAALNESFKKMMEVLPADLMNNSINCPRFWFLQAHRVWKRDIEKKSNEIKLS